ncbi:MAG: Smr/MutS family protein [Lachnospiraceae bacterium]|jgi:hypothetical protein|nr:Smr/MutS family protein [Lachnospiraceae bacterium]
MNSAGIVVVDLHGLRTAEARQKIDSVLDRCPPSVYRIRLIHGYHGGTAIAEMIREEYCYGREPRVKRVTMGENQGITELVLREY